MYHKQEFHLLSPLQLSNNKLIDKLQEFNAMLCGGAILSVFTNSKINDYDFYFRTKDDANSMSRWLSDNGYACVFESDNARSHSKDIKIQIMGIKNPDLLAKSPNHIFDVFDFTCCMGAYDFKTKSFCLDSKFLTSIASKTLEFNPLTKYPICSLFRTIKYQRRGFQLNGLEMINIAMSINMVDIRTYGELITQLRGIDTELLNDFCETIKDKKEEEFSVKDFFKLFNNWRDSLYDLNKKTAIPITTDGIPNISFSDLDALFQSMRTMTENEQ